MFNHKQFSSGRQKGAILFPILRNLNSMCTQKNNILNNLSMQTSKLGTEIPMKEKCNQSQISFIL